MRRMLCVALLAGLPVLGGTRIQDTVYYAANGQTATGQVTITWPSFRSGTRTVITGRMVFQMTAGVLSLDLEPNDAAAPAGTSYTVTYQLRDGSRATEYWVVPTSAAPKKISDVRVSTIPTPGLAVNLAQLLQSGATIGQCSRWSGTAWQPEDCVAAILATQAEAEAGTENTHTMTPLRTAQAMTALAAALAHVHLIADITGLQTALDGKSATTHAHSSGTGLTDFLPSVGTDMVTVQAGRARVGNYTPNAIVLGTARFTAGSGNVKVFVDSNNNLVCHMVTGIAATTGGSMTCGNVSAPSYPANSIPIADLTVTSGPMAVTIVSDDRAFLTTRGVAAGTGISIGDAGGVASIGIDTATVAQLGGDNAFTGNVDLTATTGFRVRRGAGAPAEGECDAAAEVGGIWARSDAAAGNATLYVCGKTGASSYGWELLGKGTYTREFTFVLGSNNGIPLTNNDDDKQIWWNNLGSTATLTKIGCISDGATWGELRPIGNFSTSWRGLTVSESGEVLIAGVYGGRLYISTDFGVTWTERKPAGDANKNWQDAVAASYLGTDLIVSDGVRLYTSANSGATWTERQPAGAADKNWRAVDTGQMGTNFIAGVYGGRLYTSADSGANWTERRPAGDADKNWQVVGTDYTGANLIAGVYGGRLYSSADSGANWTERRPAGDADKNWRFVAISFNGVKMFAGVYGGRLYTSADSGANWTERQPAGAVDLNWRSGGGSHYSIAGLIAGVQGGRLYTSTDSGAIWTERQPAGAVDLYWRASTVDGNSKFYGAVDGGRIWTFVDANSPLVNIQRDDGTPANILASDLACSAAGATTTSFVSGENIIADGSKVDFVMATMGGAVRRVTVTGTYTVTQ